MKRTVCGLQQLKLENKKFSVIAAYDATFAKVIADAGVDAILVGDSLGMVIQGKDSTLPVSIEQMVYHTEAVALGIQESEQTPIIIADMPFMSYQTSEIALDNAAKLMRAGANMIKLEGGSWLTKSVSALLDNGVPVCAHLGLTPQSVNKLGGYKVQGRSEQQQQQLIDDSMALEQAGAQMLVLECIPATLAGQLTEQTTMATIGIGAGSSTDAQVLVAHDILGLSANPAKFVKNFLTPQYINNETNNAIHCAFSAYDQAVKSGSYPTIEHQYS